MTASYQSYALNPKKVIGRMQDTLFFLPEECVLG